jgi:hypothetical protein
VTGCRLCELLREGPRPAARARSARKRPAQAPLARVHTDCRARVEQTAARRSMFAGKRPHVRRRPGPGGRGRSPEVPAETR